MNNHHPAVGRPIAVSDPALCWTAIAAHARQEHGARWLTEGEALADIIGAFDAIRPAGCGYQPATGSIRASAGPAGTVLPRWPDLPMLACSIAALAAVLPRCDLQALSGTDNLVA